MATISGPTAESIVRDVRNGDIRPVYFLTGEESYYIDHLETFLLDALLTPEERDFNLLTFFGAESDIDTVITAAKGFPMGAGRLVVLVKEAQNLASLDRFEYYLKQMQPSTVVIFCYKHGTLDRRKKIATLIEKNGVLFESKRLREAQLAPFIGNYLKRKQATIDPAAALTLADFIGADLSRLAGELDKLCIALPADGERHITPELVERLIGISKDFNVFELQDALAEKDARKALQIVNYFDKNQKLYPIQKVLPVLFKFYSNLLLAYYSPEKTSRGISLYSGVNEWVVRRSILPAMQRYTARKTLDIVSEIRRTDARSKGVGNPFTPSGELLRELVTFILC